MSIETLEKIINSFRVKDHPPRFQAKDPLTGLIGQIQSGQKLGFSGLIIAALFCAAAAIPCCCRHNSSTTTTTTIFRLYEIKRTARVSAFGFRLGDVILPTNRRHVNTAVAISRHCRRRLLVSPFLLDRVRVSQFWGFGFGCSIEATDSRL